MSDKLLPCPFCGGEANTVKNDELYWVVECHDCCAHTGGYAKREFAVAAWNIRVFNRLFYWPLKEWPESVQLKNEQGECIDLVTEKTCRLSEKNDICSSCGACIERVTHSVYDMGDGYACKPRYCPNCGARVVDD